METISKFAILRNGSYNSYNKCIARYYIRKYKWNPNQTRILQAIATNGYVVDVYNDVATIFGRPTATNGDKKVILCVGYGYHGRRKKDLMISAL